MRKGYSQLNYNELITLVELASTGYRGTKGVVAQIEVAAVFLQNTGAIKGTFSDNINADAVCYIDPANWFVQANANRVEGMYLVAPIFGNSAEASWYKIEKVFVNRDHLLSNQIDNIRCLLIKSTKQAMVS